MEIFYTATAILCFAVGLSLGLLGGGGSILMVPLFVYIAKFSATEAIALSLLIVGFSSAAGVIKYFKQGFINRRLIVLFVAPGIVASYFGARLANSVSSEKLLLMFGILMAIIAVILYAKSSEQSKNQLSAVCRPNLILSIAIGGLIGFLTGLLGVGGGFLIVPAIALLMKCSMRIAIGTSLAIISINSASGFLGHLPEMTTPAPLSMLFLVSTLGGTITGTKFSDYFSISFLEKGFAVLIFAAGCLLIAQHFQF